MHIDKNEYSLIMDFLISYVVLFKEQIKRMEVKK